VVSAIKRPLRGTPYLTRRGRIFFVGQKREEDMTGNRNQGDRLLLAKKVSVKGEGTSTCF